MKLKEAHSICLCCLKVPYANFSFTELEIKSQKESFEKEVLKLQNDQLSKLAEKESLLEQETHLAHEEVSMNKAKTIQYNCYVDYNYLAHEEVSIKQS